MADMKPENEVTKPRTLVLCFDGTANEYDKDNSNVVKFFTLLDKDPDRQLCYYDPGIGTWFHPGVVSPLFQWCAKILDLAVAWYLEAHVLDGYKFIMQNYKEGDKICLFGFSRGAYTARALAGFLHKIGLLCKDNVVQIPFAYKLYRKIDEESLELCNGFKRTFCRPVRVEFMGVWDTVASVGMVSGKTLPFTNSNSSITTFRHALALDERRARFRPNFYHRPTPTMMKALRDSKYYTAPEVPDAASSGTSSSSSSSDSSSISSRKRKSKLRSPKEKEKVGAASNLDSSTGMSGTSPALNELPDDVLEVWFAGGHSDVGGGNTLNTERHSLSNVPLRWMVSEVMKSSCGIKFLPDEVALLSLDSAEENDAIDALEPINDRLAGSFTDRLWWILEIVPLTYKWQDVQGVWHTSWGPHFGRGRDVYTPPKPKLHRSVKFRLDSNLSYEPKAKWEGDVEYVS